mgnify:CR=1 FL=1
MFVRDHLRCDTILPKKVESWKLSPNCFVHVHVCTNQYAGTVYPLSPPRLAAVASFAPVVCLRFFGVSVRPLRETVSKYVCEC